MKKSQRLEPVRDIAHDAERSYAVRLAGMEQRLQEAERRHQELQRYQREYQKSFNERAVVGLEVRSLREYQTFLAKLAAAIQAQQSLLDQVRGDCERERVNLRAAAVRRKSLSKVIEKVHSEEKKMEERKQQRELDERAQHAGRPR